MRDLHKDMMLKLQQCQSNHMSVPQVQINAWHEHIKRINKTIDHFNLVVPSMFRQMFHIAYEKQLRKAQNALLKEDVVIDSQWWFGAVIAEALLDAKN